MPLTLWLTILLFEVLLSIVACIRWKYLDRGMRIVGTSFFVSALSCIIEVITGSMGIRNHFVVHLYSLVNFSLLTGAVFIFDRKKSFRTIYGVALVLSVLVWTVAKFTFEPLETYPNFTDAAASLILIIWAVRLLFLSFRVYSPSVIRNQRFWVAGGILVANIGGALSFATTNILLKHGMASFALFWHLTWIMNIIADSMFLYSLFQASPHALRPRNS